MALVLSFYSSVFWFSSILFFLSSYLKNCKHSTISYNFFNDFFGFYRFMQVVDHFITRLKISGVSSYWLENQNSVENQKNGRNSENREIFLPFKLGNESANRNVLEIT